MPFKSKKQERFLRAKHPDIAQRWTKEHGSLLKKDDPFGISKAAMQPRMASSAPERPKPQQQKPAKPPIKMGQGVLQGITRPPQPPKNAAKPPTPGAPALAKPPGPQGPKTSTNKMGMK